MSNIHETLAALDVRLDDLRRQVARLAEEPAGSLAEQRLSGSRFSVARLPEGGAAAVQTPEAPSAPGQPEGEVQDLLAACQRLLSEARELMTGQDVGRARPAVFEGTVTLVVLGANRLQTIQVLEDSLTRAGHVTRVYVRRAQAGQVRLELSLTGGVDLVGELNRVMPFPFAVHTATAGEIVISLEGGAADL